MHGVYRVSIGAIKTHSELLGEKYLLEKINTAQE